MYIKQYMQNTILVTIVHAYAKQIDIQWVVNNVSCMLYDVLF